MTYIINLINNYIY